MTPCNDMTWAVTRFLQSHAFSNVARGARVGVPIMINVPAGARVLLATRPIDFRKGAHSLAALAQEVLAEDPFSGAVIVYRAKRSDRLKILVWDSSGLVLVWNYLSSHYSSFDLIRGF